MIELHANSVPRLILSACLVLRRIMLTPTRLEPEFAYRFAIVLDPFRPSSRLGPQDGAHPALDSRSLRSVSLFRGSFGTGDRDQRS